MSFCQYGGHDSSRIPTEHDLITITFTSNNLTSYWQICDDCRKKHVGGDPTMDILLFWAQEVSSVNQLPISLKDKPLRQSRLVECVDKILGDTRIKFGERFPYYLADINKSEKKYFLQELAQQPQISSSLLPDVDNGSKRNTIVLKLWAGAITAAKSTRPVYNASSGQQSYTIKERAAGFAKTDWWANSDEILCAGAEVAPILELRLRKHAFISLEGADKNSPIRRFIRSNIDDKSVKEADLLISDQDE